VLENAQKGKTKLMRHWEFTANDPVNTKQVQHFIKEAITLEKKG
jgi:hypothetical protein